MFRVLFKIFSIKIENPVSQSTQNEAAFFICFCQRGCAILGRIQTINGSEAKFTMAPDLLPKIANKKLEKILQTNRISAYTEIEELLEVKTLKINATSSVKQECLKCFKLDYKFKNQSLKCRKPNFYSISQPAHTSSLKEFALKSTCRHCTQPLYSTFFYISEIKF